MIVTQRGVYMLRRQPSVTEKAVSCQSDIGVHVNGWIEHVVHLHMKYMQTHRLTYGVVRVSAKMWTSLHLTYMDVVMFKCIRYNTRRSTCTRRIHISLGQVSVAWCHRLNRASKYTCQSTFAMSLVSDCDWTQLTRKRQRAVWRNRKVRISYA